MYHFSQRYYQENGLFLGLVWLPLSRMVVSTPDTHENDLKDFLKILPRHHCKRFWFIWSWALAFFNSPQIIFMCSQEWESQAHAHCSPMPMTHVLPPSNNSSLWKISEINEGPNINYPSPQTFPFFCLSLATSLFFFLLKHFTRKQQTLLKASSSERQEIPYLPASG